ncbi:MAG: mannitol dehydrogenase family protein [Paracoccus sp. (in: a-proteobacteria)]|uniref:mannitol dehydrogenase family protein n=1 Tax=Paracoccus sp. TaxID=267 RepID=UPI0026DF3A5E|nr:mannitol dehydrogenase family protein [Paracoccus sp. (in: a-proteobacteria)]MDO5613076.1 mannitol dehydrogenase family protein [Paracoccus sp. (in: a-proteobacteria)]
MRRLASLADISGPARMPGYDPAVHGRGIVHLGIGAFHRAHQAVMTDDALAAQGGDWRITGVSLRSKDVAQAMNPQHGLYTLIERGAAGTSARVVAAIQDVIAADPAATLIAMVDPKVRIVTLTVTEKGYGIDRSTQDADPHHPAVAGDLADPAHPSGVLGLLTRALQLRREAGTSPFTVLCCDNLPENGTLLRNGVTGFARQIDPALAEWIAANVAFPSSMVDRITPAATPETLAEAQHQTGCTDLAAVETEPFLQWVIEDHFPTGRPAWEAAGALFVTDVAPYERMKLTMLNGSHSMLAYAGFLSGCKYVRDVMANPELETLVARHHMAAAQTLPPLPDIDLTAYAKALQDRFRNPAIAHETFQIAMDGTEKLPQRIFQPALVALEQGQDLRPFAFAAAAWMRYTMGETDEGQPYALRDPREAEIRAALSPLPSEGAAISQALLSLPGFVPEPLRDATEWRRLTAEILSVMISHGMAEAIHREVQA